ncbi:SIR2 family protein [Salipiger thiooxidans]|uniref:SIR2 family protein n=1 Tax=Salipiger thiooxidans TaxID=282683 RepID=UPI001A8D2719|nr:SIR2 family protein [Salipiger thiooxidans]MBN8190242.1 SIR2 family protein [Salipiger thiooxidans]
MTATPLDRIEYQLIGLAEDGGVGDLLEGLDQKQGRIRLQALISEWLRMENLVVLTGSGTSVSAGGKTMANLETAVFETIQAMSDLPASIAPIIESRQNWVQFADVLGEPIGFESWLSFVANALVVAENVGGPFGSVVWPSTPAPTRVDLRWFVDRLRIAIFAECALSLPDSAPAPPPDKTPPQLAFLSKLVARDSNLGRTHLFTLNYDTLFEQALELLGVQYFDGFTGRAAARFDPSVYGLDIYYPGEVAEGRVRRFDKFLHFYKLHGSIHWFEHGLEMRARHPDLAPYRAYAGMTAAQKATALVPLVQNARSVGILPTANKFVQTLTMPYAHLFRSFQVRLGHPQTFLLVLGYGFGDDHVTQIIENALMNPSLVMLVVEPNPNSQVISRIRRYKDLGKRAFVLCPTEAAFDLQPYSHATFDDFARTVMPDVQWLEDFLRLRRFEKQIASSEPPTTWPDQ